MINNNSRVKLAQGAHPFLRADNVMQFGTDATRTGLVTTEHAKDVAALLGVLMRPRRLGWVVEQLAELDQPGPDDRDPVPAHETTSSPSVAPSSCGRARTFQP